MFVFVLDNVFLTCVEHVYELGVSVVDSELVDILGVGGVGY